MEAYDYGGKNEAAASFLSDAGKHEGTQHIAADWGGLIIDLAELDVGRAKLEKFFRDFNV